MYVCKRSDVNARAYYTSAGMLVLQGSSAPFNTERKQDPRFLEQHDQMLQKGVISKEGDRFVFQRDFLLFAARLLERLD